MVLAGAVWVSLTATGSGHADDAATDVSVARVETMLETRPHAVDEAWRLLTSRGLPLIEPSPDDPDMARVTFAYKAPYDAVGVRLDSVINAPRAAPVVRDYVRDFTLPMTRVAGSEIWAITLDVPRDVQAVYSFLVDRGEGWQRRSDSANRRKLRGNAAEAILQLDRVGDLSAIRPWPRRLQPEPDRMSVISPALGRDVSVELFRSPDAGPGAPVVILWDSFLWGVRAPAVEIAGNLANAGHIPAAHIVLIDQLDADSAQSAYADQTAFVADDLLPALEAAGIGTDRVVLGGASRRGLAASRVALDRPDLIDGVIALSGSFYWSPEGEAPEWLAREIGPAAPDAPAFYLAAGSLEFVVTTTNGGHVMLDTNRRFDAALEAAGYDTAFAVYGGGHDIAGWRLALADGLVALLGD